MKVETEDYHADVREMEVKGEIESLEMTTTISVIENG